MESKIKDLAFIFFATFTNLSIISLILICDHFRKKREENQCEK